MNRPTFILNERNSFYQSFKSSGSPVTGVSASDLDIDLAKGTSHQSGDAALTSFKELESTEMPGLYHLEFSDSVFDSKGEIIFRFASGKFDTTTLRGEVVGGDLDDTHNLANNTNTMVSSIDSTVTTIDGHIPAEVAQKQHLVDGSGDLTPPTDTGIWDIFGDGSINLKDIDDKVKRSLGLSQENQLIKDHTYDSNGNLTESTIQIYPSKNDLITEQNLTAEYKMIADYDSNNQLVKYEVRREK